VIVDSKGRLLIPKEMRKKVGLRVGGKARLRIENNNIVIIPLVSPEGFIKEMEGCLKEGKPTLDPFDVKKIWEPVQKRR
jgi:AbrB family looped-hinge helix DNA binding protein